MPLVPKYIFFDIFNFRQNNTQKMLDVFRLTLFTICSMRNLRVANSFNQTRDKTIGKIVPTTAEKPD